MANIDDLLTAIMGQTDTALNAPPAPWQQELLESVNPEKVKRQNIARALAKASTAMATTPGNFLSGISAAAATGADSYLTGREQADDQRIKVQQLLGLQQQKDQDRRLSLLMDALGVQNKVLDNKRAEEDRQYGRTKDEREWGLRKQESDARINYYNRRGVDGADELNANQTRNAKQWIIDSLTRLERRLSDIDSPEYIDDPNLRQERILREQDRLERSIGVRLYTDDAAASPQVQTIAPGKVDQVVPQNSGITQPPAGGILNAPPPPEQRQVGRVYDTPKGKFIWNGSGWDPAI